MEKNHYSDIQKAMIYGSYLALKDYTGVANLYYEEFSWSLDRSTVCRIVETYQITGNFKRSKGSGRPEKIGEFEEQLLAESLVNQKKSLSQAAMDIEAETQKNTTKSSLSRHAQNLNLVYVKPTISKELSDNSFEILNCLVEIIASIGPEKAVWGDESFFTLQWKYTPKQWVQRGDKVEVMLQNPNLGIHAFGAISLKGRTELYFLPKGQTWNQQTYIEALQTVLLPFWQRFHKTRHCHYVQDNARSHIGSETKKWLEIKGIQHVQLPAYSPQLNPIEHIWGALKERVYKNGSFSSLESLHQKIRDEWQRLPDDLIVNCIETVVYSRLLNPEYFNVL